MDYRSEYQNVMFKFGRAAYNTRHMKTRVKTFLLPDLKFTKYEEKFTFCIEHKEYAQLLTGTGRNVSFIIGE